MRTPILSNIIYYTTSDNQPIKIPTHSPFLGGNILAHTYDGDVAHIVFDKPIEKIGSKAFAGCKKLRDIHMGNRVESIGGSTFENCKNIKNINLPDKIRFVGNMAFEGCCKLKNIAIASIGTWMNITFESFSSNPLVANHRGTNLYVNGELLENLIIPCNVTEIDDRFRNCLSIKTITLPDGLIVIRDNAFMGCRSLLNVYIPSSVTSIGRAAFWGCCNLSNINIPYSVNYIGENAFSHCEGLRKIKGKYASEDERSLIFDGILKAAVLLGFEDYFIPDNVTTIERCVLDNEFVVDMDAVRKNGLLN